MISNVLLEVWARVPSATAKVSCVKLILKLVTAASYLSVTYELAGDLLIKLSFGRTYW